MDIAKAHMSYAPQKQETAETYILTPMICRLFWYSYTVVILLKRLHQNSCSTVDWVRRRHNTTAESGPAPESCTGPRTC